MDNIGINDMVQKSITWIKPEYKEPEAREELYLIIFSGNTKNVTYDNTIATAFYDPSGWFIESTPAKVENLRVHYYAHVNIPDECEVRKGED